MSHGKNSIFTRDWRKISELSFLLHRNTFDFGLWAQIKWFSWIRWKVPRFYRWSCIWMNDDLIAQKKLLNMAVSDESLPSLDLVCWINCFAALLDWIQIHLTSKFELNVHNNHRFNSWSHLCLILEFLDCRQRESI